MKKIFTVLGLALGLFWPIIGQAAEGQQHALLQEARQAYDKGQFDKAVADYQQLLEKGYDNGALYYNAGNAALKAGHLGEAVGFYRRAARRLPWDDDVEHNLEFARSLVKQPPVKSGPFDILINKIFIKISPAQWTFLALVAYGLLMVSLGFLILTRAHHAAWSWTASGLGLLFMVLAVLASMRILIEKNVKWAVVITSQAEARNGPARDYQVGFTIPEGREVRILGREGNWRAVGLPQEGYKGWVKANELWEE
jgi:tetratricopeptide (TPR) repeat protein